MFQLSEPDLTQVSFNLSGSSEGNHGLGDHPDTDTAACTLAACHVLKGQEPSRSGWTEQIVSSRTLLRSQGDVLVKKLCSGKESQSWALTGLPIARAHQL